eukprot:CAMPEP_0194505034 /NCGR_PEP_ID=MMETSP0253-20130528/31049_1 /TAXON_ID=2966 /ORGANISM="Noctiluca scintillans" /LENGTH=128 /DNA_ID=CAMNT_0039347521 /DNA_START=214 /DNA_END=597 /DNA_ORIENTATION=+
MFVRGNGGATPQKCSAPREQCSWKRIGTLGATLTLPSGPWPPNLRKAQETKTDREHPSFTLKASFEASANMQAATVLLHPRLETAFRREHEPQEKRTRFCWPALELRVELATDEEGMPFELAQLHALT